MAAQRQRLLFADEEARDGERESILDLDPTVAVVIDLPDTTASVYLDRQMFRRALINLIRNAVEAMGGAGRLDVRITRQSLHVVVAIADHGPGIPAENRQRVFEPYYTEKSEGTGLGLSIVKQAIDHHRGTISARETDGGGATFEVRFPLKS